MQLLTAASMEKGLRVNAGKIKWMVMSRKDGQQISEKGGKVQIFRNNRNESIFYSQRN